MLKRMTGCRSNPNVWYTFSVFSVILLILAFANLTVKSQTLDTKIEHSIISGLELIDSVSNTTSYRLSAHMAILRVTGKGDFIVKAASPGCSPLNNVDLESFPQAGRISIEYRSPLTWGISSLNPTEENFIVFQAAGRKCSSITGESPFLMKLVLTVPDQ